MTNKEILLLAVRSAVDERSYEIDFSECDPEKLYRMAACHDMAHLVYDAMRRAGFTPSDKTVYDRYVKAYQTAVYRAAKLDVLYDKTCETLEHAGIDYVPLKGLRLKKLYPAEWMRTSCDADVLVRGDSLEEAAAALTAAGFVTDGKMNFHDVAFSYEGMTLELHFSIMENDPRFDELLGEVWTYTEPASGHRYEETAAYFAFHHIAHICRHFLVGGCGIKPLADLYLMKKHAFFDEEKLMVLLERGGLASFYRCISALTDVWFGGRSHDETTSATEKYILQGGVYGSFDNRDRVTSASVSTRSGTLIQRAFPGLTSMRVLYPVLKKCPVLLPFCYVHRGISLLFGKRGRETRLRIERVITREDAENASVSSLLQILGLTE